MKTDTIIVGGGQAGLSVSYCLKQQGCEHIILEQSSQAADSWRNGRWDSFTLVSPNWAFNLPGLPYSGSSPDGFMDRKEIIKTFDQYVQNFGLPIVYNQKVTSVIPKAEGGFEVHTTSKTYECSKVVVAAGFFQQSRIPEFSSEIPLNIIQMHSGQYRNPHLLPPGAVLVIGSAQSGCQITDELVRHGKKVFLSTGSAGRAPRRYRGKDIFYWLNKVGFFDKTADQLPDPSFRFAPTPHVSGVNGGRTLNLHKFARQGVTLLGHIKGIRNNKLIFAPDLKENLKKADMFESEIIKMIDNYISENGLDAPEETLPQLTDGFNQPGITELDLNSFDISTIIWASGYRFSFDFVKCPVFDNFGFPVQKRGVTEHPGLYFIGLPWLYKPKSGLLVGIAEDAEYLAGKITAAEYQEN